MSDVVIRGLCIPKPHQFRNFYLGGNDDGTATVHDPNTGKQIGVAFPLPEGHGRLVDEDEIKTRMTRKMYACKHNSVDELTYAVCIDIVDHADTIIEAEGGGEE